LIVIRVKVSREIKPLSLMEIDRADDRPMGRFAWTNHIYFEISPAVVPLHLCTSRGGLYQ
jgi:hypothetical protein